MDCNSLIYDSYYRLEKKIKTSESAYDRSTIEKILIRDVIESIQEHMRFISPTKTAYIAFDGVPPFAKMDQQKIRRYKTQYMVDMAIKNAGELSLWNTTAITPGTDFMRALNAAIHAEFAGKEEEWGLQKLWISGADDVGEGEHKLFHCLRSETGLDFGKDHVAIYGLDSDLIMLSIFHHEKYCKSIHVFREAPEFKTVLSKDFEEKEKLFMDIGALAGAIAQEMNVDTAGVYDYVFMCFFLGNDFMPHFPAFNIRTHGIQVLTETYSNVIGKSKDRHFISHEGVKAKIEWKWVHAFIGELAKQEYDHLLTEYKLRDKFDGRQWTENTPQEREQLLNNVPIIYREDEKYICPKEDGWEMRYYRTLFGIETMTEETIRAICMNYLEGLEWVYRYYTDECVDWRWKYNYSYPPLMKDLARYVLEYKSGFPVVVPTVNNAFNEDLLLAYVLPRAKLDLSPNAAYLLETYPENYPETYRFQWAFCRYFWEAHPLLPEIDMKQLDELNTLFMCNHA